MLLERGRWKGHPGFQGKGEAFGGESAKCIVDHGDCEKGIGRNDRSVQRRGKRLLQRVLVAGLFQKRGNSVNLARGEGRLGLTGPFLIETPVAAARASSLE